MIAFCCASSPVIKVDAFSSRNAHTLIACFFALQILESLWVVIVLRPPPEEKHIPGREGGKKFSLNTELNEPD